MKKLLLAALSVMALNSCYNDKYDKLYPTPTTTVCDTSTISFAHDIVPILTANCTINSSCHLGASSTSGYDMSTYAGIMDNSAYPTQDVLINDINGTPLSRRHAMPKDLPKIAACDINKLTKWVNAGTPNN